MNCANCGANVSLHDKVCSYCGTDNPDYSPIEDDVNVLLEKGLTAFQNERFSEAIKHYEQALAFDPNVFDAYFYLAASYTSLKRKEEALRAMEKARLLRPGSAPVYYNLGILCKQLGRKDEARTYLEKALDLAKRDSAVDNKDFERRVKKELAEFKRWKLF